MTITATLRFEVVPFEVPETVRLRNNHGHDFGVCLEELSPETLDAICEQFANRVFEIAGKRRTVGGN